MHVYIIVILFVGGGVGRLLSEKFAERGCHLVLWDVDQDLMEQTLNSVRSKYSTVAVAYKVDLTDRNAIYKLAKQASALYYFLSLKMLSLQIFGSSK